MQNEFNHAANDSPRSGSTKKVAPVVGVAIVIAIIVSLFRSRHSASVDDASLMKL